MEITATIILKLQSLPSYHLYIVKTTNMLLPVKNEKVFIIFIMGYYIHGMINGTNGNNHYIQNVKLSTNISKITF